MFGSVRDIFAATVHAGSSVIETAELTNVRSTTAPAGGRARRWLVLYPRAIPLAIFLAICRDHRAQRLRDREQCTRARTRRDARICPEHRCGARSQQHQFFSSYLRAGAAAFRKQRGRSARKTFDNFVRALRLDMDYPGAEGIGWLPVIEAPDVPDFMAQVRARQPGFPDIYPTPVATTGRIAPVTMFCPGERAQPPRIGL